MFNKLRSLLRDKIRGEIPLNTLIKMGLKIGKNHDIQFGCVIDYSHCWLISIGDNVTLAPRVHILAHDASTKRSLGYTKIGNVTIGDNVFLGAGSIVLPNVKIGDDVIIGAGSVVTKDIPENSLAAGNPARVIGNTSDVMNKNKLAMQYRPVFDGSWTIRGNITDAQKEEMKNRLEDGFGYVE